MVENNKNNTGRTLIDLIFERPWTALLILFAIFGGIFFLGISGIGVKIPGIIITSPPKPVDTTTPKTTPIKEEPLPVTPNTTPNVPPSKPLVEKREQHKKIIEGSLDFQTPPSSDHYFIKVQGKGDYQRVEKSGNFIIFVDPTETVIHVDVFDQDKEKITSKNIEVDAATNNTIQIIIK